MVRKMKTLRLLPALILVPSTVVLAMEGSVPEPFPSSRYAKMLDDSPFAVATPQVEQPPEEGPPWSAQLFLGSTSDLIVNGEVVPTIWVKSKSDPSYSVRLTGTEPDVETQIQLVRLEWSENPSKSKAVIKKGTEFATLECNQADFAPGTQPVPQPHPGTIPQPRPPGIPPAGMGRRGPFPQPQSPPQMRPQPIPQPPVIPRPTTIGQPPQNQAPGIPKPNERKRIRVINNSPNGG
jgi:hypothetical protein